MNAANRDYHHPLIIRLTHWVNFLALGIMVVSGLRIYNASPIWNFRVPEELTFGGWLAGARQWHFFAMWLFFINGFVWVVYNLATRHGRRTTIFGRADLGGVIPMMLYYLRLRKEHPAGGKYNALQKLAYTVVPLLALGAILSGLAIYWPVQFGVLTRLFGRYDEARVFHFIFMAGLVLFFAGHLLMVVIAGWRNFVSMITGWSGFPEPAPPSPPPPPPAE